MLLVAPLALQLVASPDVPMPFAPELETCCRPDAQHIAAAINLLLEETEALSIVD